MTSAYLNALNEEGTREDLLREVGRLYDENEALRKAKAPNGEPAKDVRAVFVSELLKGAAYKLALINIKDNTLPKGYTPASYAAWMLDLIKVLHP